MDIRSNLQSLQDIFRTSETASGQGASRAHGSGDNTTAAAGIDGDEARVSRAASLASQAASVSDVRQTKVDAVRSALASGSYQVSSSEVAGKLIDHMLNAASGIGVSEQE